MEKQEYLKLAHKMGFDPSLIDDKYIPHLHEQLDMNGVFPMDVLGLMLPFDDLPLIRECIAIFAPIMIAAPNKKLFDLNTKDDDDYIGFTHLIPYYEHNVWLMIYASPYRAESHIN